MVYKGQARDRTPCHPPLLSDWRSFDNWKFHDAKDATTRANEIWKALLAEYREPEMPAGALEEIDRYIARRKEEIKKKGVV